MPHAVITVAATIKFFFMDIALLFQKPAPKYAVGRVLAVDLDIQAAFVQARQLVRC